MVNMMVRKGGRMSVTDGGDLKIRDIRLEDAGEYVCELYVEEVNYELEVFVKSSESDLSWFFFTELSMFSSSVYSDIINHHHLPGCGSHHPPFLLCQDRTGQGTQATQTEGQAYDDIFHLSKTCQVRSSQPSLPIEEQHGTTTKYSQATEGEEDSALES